MRSPLIQHSIFISSCSPGNHSLLYIIAFFTLCLCDGFRTHHTGANTLGQQAALYYYRKKHQRIHRMAPQTTSEVSIGTSSREKEFASSSTSSSDVSANVGNQNWRVIPSKSANYRPYIEQREAWSQKQFQESLELYNKLMSCTDSYVEPGIKEALNTLDHAYRLYGPESVICSFNGGKDAVVILHLLRAAHAKFYNSTMLTETGSSTHCTATNASHARICRPRVIYFEHPDEWDEILDFLRMSVEQYDLDMMAFEQGVKFSAGLQILVQNNYLFAKDEDSNRNEHHVPLRPYPMAFVLGTRISDPNAVGQSSFAPSSHYMPPFMRVNPILEWTYGHVWHFLRLFQLPYCSLYDQGYTSLGTTKDTLPCPALQVVSATNTVTPSTSRDDDLEGSSTFPPKFWPAYMLQDWDQERAGRIKKEVTGKGGNVTATTTRTTNTSKSATSGISSRAKTPMSRAGSTISNVSDFRKSDPSPLLAVDTTILDGRTVAGGGAVGGSVNTNTTGGGETETIYTIESLNDDEQHQPPEAPKTVGLLIIGDEILKGMTLDLNTNAAAKALRKENVLLRRVVVCSDDPEEIVKDLHRLLREDKVDVIITSGGVGPTHDDVTIKSVATALNQELVLNKEMVDLLVEKMQSKNTLVAEDSSLSDGNDDDNSKLQDDEKPELTEAQIKMSTLPSNARLRYLSLPSSDNEKTQDQWPILQCRNIFVLPGVPEFFAPKIELIANYLSSSRFERSVAYKIVLSIDEASIVDILNQVVSRHPEVSFGSYPFVSHPEFKTVVTLEACYPQQQQHDRQLSSMQSSWTSLTNRTINVATTSSGMAAVPKTALTGSGSFVLSSSSKDQRDRQVKVALDDLVNQLPKRSVLRVENEV